MTLSWSRYLALLFAIGLGIGETVMNWGHWQYAPLWIVDYIIVGWLLWSFFKTRSGRNVYTLLGGWAFTAGVFYMALFVGLDPISAYHLESNVVLLVLIGFMFAVSVIGFLCALLAAHAQQGGAADAASQRPRD